MSLTIMVIAVAFHYWSLGQLLNYLPSRDEQHQHFLRPVLVLLLLVSVHLVVIMGFAVGLYFLSLTSGAGQLEGGLEQNFMDFFYHSAVTYSTLGMSEMPQGHLKFMTALESLTGIILLTWSATFYYSVMGRGPESQ
ncbi:ion channel [Coraliomargarita sp. SDUM461004]|uniref:Ion channel n=1 Tax=Thalassobacterium sedimentorum TaxID=3041258 RepID=A0ABU1AJC2_9BACT|nr:ion channel [Coraliomargarita sp. SDUM461004]MDQ8194895.1 ion channel [Coraliomargarita sp. SDUM461004]